MEEIFKNIDSKKRDRIINSALIEFGENKFKKASTNNIVKNAGISKGLLYHYFKSKKILYEQLRVFVIETTTNAILNKIDWEEKDIFERIKQIGMIKMEVWDKFPGIVSFGKVMYEGMGIKEIWDLASQYTPNLINEVYSKNIDFSLFKDGMDIEKAIQIIQWTIEKYGENWLDKAKTYKEVSDFKEMLEEIDLYLLLLKKGFYKKV